MFLSFFVFDGFFRLKKNRDFGYSWSNISINYRPLVEGRIANFGIFLDVCEFLRLG